MARKKAAPKTKKERMTMLYRLTKKAGSEELGAKTQEGAILRAIKKAQPATAAAIRKAVSRSFKPTPKDKDGSRRVAFYLHALKKGRLIASSAR